MHCWQITGDVVVILVAATGVCRIFGEALFPGLDLDSGLDWTLDWTLENMYFWRHCSTKEARGPVPCPLEAQTLIHVYVSW